MNDEDRTQPPYDPILHAAEMAYKYVIEPDYFWKGPPDAVLDTMDRAEPWMRRLQEYSPYMREALPFIERYREYIAAKGKAKQTRADLAKDYAETFVKIGRRDGFRCALCGDSDDLHIDHIYPVSKGGNNDLSNLQLLCPPCNLRKGANT